MTMSKDELYQGILEELELQFANLENPKQRLQAVCQILADKIDFFDWVGFYLVDPAAQNELILGPYVGDATDHNRISFGRGICGQAAERGETFVVQDVSKEDNYLSCSISVKSEIVLPVFSDGSLVGELDIDSHKLAPFTSEDRHYLEIIAEKCGPHCKAYTSR